MRCRNDQNLTDPRQHQRGERIVNHWFVVDRQQLLGSHQGHWIESRTATAGQNNALQDVPQFSAGADDLNNHLMNFLRVEGGYRRWFPALRSRAMNWLASLPAWDS